MTQDLGDTLKLAWLVDEHWGKAYPIGHRVTIGRGAENKVILRNEEVSRLHAEVVRDDDHFVLHSLGASGTKVNGVPCAALQELKDGDILEIGFSLLRFQTSRPSAELMIVPQDAPIPRDTGEGPTAAAIPAAKRPSMHYEPRPFRRLWLWLTRRPNTD